MIVRALDGNGDWLFGKGLNDYKVDSQGSPKATEQSIQTRLKMFLGDCFFAVNNGIDWFNLLGSKNQVALNLAIGTVILNTDNVTGLDQLSVILNSQRQVTIQYDVATLYGDISSEFSFDIGSGV